MGEAQVFVTTVFVIKRVCSIFDNKSSQGILNTVERAKGGWEGWLLFFSTTVPAFSMTKSI